MANETSGRRDNRVPFRASTKTPNIMMLRRTRFLLIVCGILAFAVLGIKLFNVMIVHHDEYEKMAIDQQVRTTEITASRGAIYDTNGKILAMNASADTIFISPAEIVKNKEDPQLIARELSEILDVDYDKILAMTKKGYTKSELNEHMSEESIMIITGGNASVDFESWDKSIADENSNLHLVSYGPRGDTTRCFLVPLYYLTKNYARQDALKKYLDSYVEARSKLAKKPQLILADFMMRTGKDNHGDPAGQRVFTGPDGKERIYSPLVLNTKGPNDSRIGKMLDTSAHEYLDVGDNADQLWWVALDFKDECRPIYHMRFMKEDDARKHGFEPRGQDAESGMMWDAIDNHYVCLKFSPDDSHKEPVSGVGIARKGKSDDLYYVIATSPGTDMTLPYSIDEQFPAYWGSKEYKLKSENPPYRFGVDQENDLNEGDSWFGRNKATNHKQWIFPVYTTKALDWPIRFTKATD